MNNDDEPNMGTSCSLRQWEALLAETQRDILAALNRWREEHERCVVSRECRDASNLEIPSL
jgi:hypothetical protein